MLASVKTTLARKSCFMVDIWTASMLLVLPVPCPHAYRILLLVLARSSALLPRCLRLRDLEMFPWLLVGIGTPERNLRSNLYRNSTP